MGQTVAEKWRFFSFQNGNLPSSCMLNLSNYSLCWKILQFSDFHLSGPPVSWIVESLNFQQLTGVSRA